jgi:response regulator RpfG family c-di-GMP phosphodiesterase
MIQTESGAQFDKDIVESFVQNEAKFSEIRGFFAEPSAEAA